MVDVWLPYDKTEVCARIPTRNLLDTIEPNEQRGVPDPEAEILRALNNPISSKSLDSFVEAEDTVAIVVDDATRPAPSHLILPPVLKELNRLGVPNDKITVIFGCGTHRAVTDAEVIELLGRDIASQVKTVSHNCHADDQVLIGTTKNHGTKVYVNKIFADADIRILTGDVEMHYYAGYGGGRKSVLPGVASHETIQHNHTLTLDPRARTSILEGNPVHEDMTEAAKLANVDFIVNVVLNGKREIVRAVAGDLEEAFYSGVKLAEQMYKISISRRADIVIVSSGGHPADINLYQACKAVENSLDSVKRGGVIVLVAECKEGYGNEMFYEWMTQFQNLASMEKQLRKQFTIGGYKAYCLSRALQKAHIILVSTLPDYYAVNVFKLRTARNVTDALEDAFEIAGRNAKILAIPHGHTTFPVLTT